KDETYDVINRQQGIAKALPLSDFENPTVGFMEDESYRIADWHGISLQQYSHAPNLASQIINRNKVILASAQEHEHGRPTVSPKEIWDFLSHLGVVDDKDEAETIKRIQALEARDLATFEGQV
ncbi:hypothetical protein Ancab_017030, partial [Ancistrocladus abbreviatus]